MNQPAEPQIPIWFQSQDLRISLPEPDVRLDFDAAEARLRHGNFWEVYEFIGQELTTGLLTLGKFLRTENA